MRKTGFIWIIFLWGASMQAQEVKKLSLQEAMDLATQNSKQVQTDDLRKQALEIKKEQTKNAMLPSIGFTSSYARLSKIPLPVIPGFTQDIVELFSPDIRNQYTNRFYVQQPVFSGLKYWNTLKAIDQQKAAADMDKQKDNEDAKWSVVQTYYNLYKLEQTRDLLDSSIAQTEVRVINITRYRDAGIVLNNDVMRAELQKTNLMVSKADVESAIRIANFNLCVLLGLDINTIIEVSSPSIVDEASSTLQSMISSAYTDRAELKAQDYRSKAADYSIKASKSAYMPTLSLVGNTFVNNPNQRIFPLEVKFRTTWDVGLSLSWNVMQLYTARAAVSEAENQKAQLLKTTEQIKDGIQTEVNANYETLKVTLLKIGLAEKAIEQARENKRILDNRFEAQVALFTDVLEADQLMLQAEAQLLNAKADAAIANYKLMRSLGTIK